jgi:adenine-specific DNA-methyltransferase
MAEKTFLVKKDKGDIKFIQNKDNGWTVMHKVRKPDGKAFRSIINSITNSDAAKEMVEIFGADLFDNPKPSALISKLIYLSTTESDIILDFFAGSGSTAHSVMNINLEHQESNRKFILVQIPQVINDSTETGKEAIRAGFKKISDITIERNKRVIEKIITKKKTQKPDLFTNETKEDALKGLGFKVFKLVKSNFPRVEYAPDPEKTDEENIELLKKYISEKEAQLVSSFNRDELMTEILLKKGFNLNYTVALHLELKGQREGKIGTYVQRIDIVRDGEKEALICMDEFLLNETIEYFKKHINRKFICLERALDTTKKYNLKHYMGDNFIAF